MVATTLQIKEKIDRLRRFYNSGITKSIDFRIDRLRTLKQSIIHNQREIEAALWSDLRKSPEEAYLTEISIILQEIDLHIKNIRKWAKRQKVKTPISLFPSSSYIQSEPLGVALIIAPWNYPFQLIMNPLIGAISAGCTSMLKTSPAAPATALIIEKIIRGIFECNYIDIVHGGREVNSILLEQKYDIIFFTGSPELGKVVYKAAANNLTPVILELGGKSPCIVDRLADIPLAARRIAWGKWINAGQTCIAPDYLFVHKSIKKRFLARLKFECEQMYGIDASQSKFYSRIVNEVAFDRLISLIKDEEIYYGGESDREQKYISPTILVDITPESKVMEGEIFGPILPVLTFGSITEVIEYVNNHEKPLALYYFGQSNENVLENISSGGACINDTIMHIANHHLPFGGVGNSGIGKYHGKSSFDAFSNQRGIVKSSIWIDLPMRYPPFKYFKLTKRILR